MMKAFFSEADPILKLEVWIMLAVIYFVLCSPLNLTAPADQQTKRLRKKLPRPNGKFVGFIAFSFLSTNWFKTNAFRVSIQEAHTKKPQY